MWLRGYENLPHSFCGRIKVYRAFSIKVLSFFKFSTNKSECRRWIFGYLVVKSTTLWLRGYENLPHSFCGRIKVYRAFSIKVLSFFKFSTNKSECRRWIFGYLVVKSTTLWLRGYENLPQGICGRIKVYKSSIHHWSSEFLKILNK